MLIRNTRRAALGGLALAATGFGAFVVAQSVSGGFDGFWGPQYRSSATARSAAPPNATAIAEQERRGRPAPTDPRSRLIHWNRIAIDASGVDHTPVGSGETRVFGEQIGPGRSSRAIAIVHIAIADAVNAIHGDWRSYTRQPSAPIGASVDAAIAQTAHDTLAAMFPSQATSFRNALREELDRVADRGKDAGRLVGLPAYPSGHAGFGGALFEVLRQFYRTDNIAFTFVSDEFNGITRGSDGTVRPLVRRSFRSLSEAEEENGQSRIYLGIHWSFDKTQGIAQGRRVARYVMRNAFAPL